MMLRLLSFLWGFMPSRLALAIWRIAPGAELTRIKSESGGFPVLSKDNPWGVAETMEYHRLSMGESSMSQEDEKLIRLAEIRKSRFFKGVPSLPAAILASALADKGLRLGDLRATNTALKLRDLAACSLPPLSSTARAHFHDADKALEKTLYRLRGEAP